MTMDLLSGERGRKKTTREKLQEIIGLIYDLNEQTELDWFLSFSGHVDSVSVYYDKIIGVKCESCGKEANKKVIDITILTSIKRHKEIDNIIKELKTYLPEDK